VDDFGVKYESLANAHHLIKALEQHYTVSKDWTGGMYCGITLKWDYLHKHVDISMPGYITAMLNKYQHPPAKRPQYAPSTPHTNGQSPHTVNVYNMPHSHMKVRPPLQQTSQGHTEL
jgi:hypothetical protein